jgi:hypothetical protein
MILGKPQKYKHRPAQSLFHRACTPQASQADDPQAFTIFTGLHPSLLHRPVRSLPGCTPHACTISAGTMPLKPAKQAIQRYTISTPLACALQACQPMLQRPTSLPQGKSSPHRPVGPHPPATHHRRAPNLPKRHTQTDLDAKGVTSE